MLLFLMRFSYYMHPRWVCTLRTAQDLMLLCRYDLIHALSVSQELLSVCMCTPMNVNVWGGGGGGGLSLNCHHGGFKSELSPWGV